MSKKTPGEVLYDYRQKTCERIMPDWRYVTGELTEKADGGLSDDEREWYEDQARAVFAHDPARKQLEEEVAQLNYILDQHALAAGVTRSQLTAWILRKAIPYQSDKAQAETIEQLRELIYNPDENANERFERIGELYYKDTLFLRPGKGDWSQDTNNPENVKRFEDWYHEKCRTALAASEPEKTLK